MRLCDRHIAAVFLYCHHKFGKKPGACGVIIQIDRKGQLNILLILYDILAACQCRLVRLFLEKIVIPVVADRQILRFHGDIDLPRLRVDQAAFNAGKVSRVFLGNLHFLRAVFYALDHIAGGVHQGARGILAGILSDAVLPVLGLAVLG